MNECFSDAPYLTLGGVYLALLSSTLSHLLLWLLLWFQLQVGVEFEASTRMQETSMSFGYTLDVPKANLLFKGTPPHLLQQWFPNCFSGDPFFLNYKPSQ